MKQIKILLVDDEEEFVTTLSDRMQIKNLDSDFVLSGEQALQSLGNQIPDVMILDLKMPGINGMEVLKRVKKDYPQVQVIILTGHGSDRDKQESADLGAFEYFIKPVDIDALIESIKNAYQQKTEIYGEDSTMGKDKFSTVSMKSKPSLKDKVSGLSEKMDRYQEAITFAEADQHEYAKEVLDRKPESAASATPTTPGKLVVVGNESEFHADIIDYALEMAKRMECEIVALNTAPLSCKSSKLFSSSWKNLCEEFKTLSEENIKTFKEKVEGSQIGFTHVIDFIETDDALNKLNTQFKGINLVIAAPEEPVQETVAVPAKQQRRPRQGFLVYAMS